MYRPRLLDLFCGAGGCSVGYHRAGFDVVGVDIKPQPRYPFAFIQANAIDVLNQFLWNPQDGVYDNAGRGYVLDCFAVVHASPPCQRYSKARHCPGAVGREYPDLLPRTLDVLDRLGKPWIVENVPGAPLPHAITLCGTMFGLPLRRHRLFGASHMILAPAAECRHRDGDLTVFGHCVQVCGSRGVAYVAGSGRTHFRPLRVGVKEGGRAMGIDWMNRGELSEAIPPAYCEWVGRQLLPAVAP